MRRNTDVSSRIAIIGLMALLAFAPLVSAEEAPAKPTEQSREALPRLSTTHHDITIDGRALHYTTEAGVLRLRDENGKATAEVFHVAHRLHPYDPARPITFVFNGGPGAASAFLQLGAMGPRVVETGDRGEILPPPPRLQDNPDSWIDITDMVFVDPVGTGYSRALNPSDDENFWGVEKDVDALAEFIRLYLTRQGRLTSPVFLVGESYGGFRSARLAKKLPTVGVRPSGVVLVSPALEFSVTFGDSYNPLTYALLLPSLAASNLEKRGLDDDEKLTEALREAEEFALTDYLVGLAAGVEASKGLSERVAELTGLPVPVVEKHYARIPASVFRREYKDGRFLSVYDGSIGAPDPGTHRREDAVLDRMVPAWTTGFVEYAQKELDYKVDDPYRLLNREVRRKWDFGTRPTRQGFAGSLDELNEARSANPDMRVMLAQGYTDLVTPYMAGEYLVKQLAPLEGAQPIVVKNYPGGHMHYLREDSRAAFKRDARALYEAAGGGPGKASEGAPPS
jgi:carboxypeptidase C (cathepsin A)